MGEVRRESRDASERAKMGWEEGVSRRVMMYRHALSRLGTLPRLVSLRVSCPSQRPRERRSLRRGRKGEGGEGEIRQGD
jgi:hypothetical protein